MASIIYWIGSHPLYLFLALSYFAMCFWLIKFQKKLGLRWGEIYLIPLVHLVIGFISAKLLALIEVGFDTERAAFLRLYGAVFVLPGAYYLWARLTKRNPRTVLDMATLCVMVGLLFGRINCLKAGCCRGVNIAGDDSHYLPLVEMEMVFYVLFAVFSVGPILKGKTRGQAYPLYMILYGAFRFIAEFFRVEFTTQVGMLHLAHIWSLLSITVGVAAYILNRKKCTPPAGSRKNMGTKA